MEKPVKIPLENDLLCGILHTADGARDTGVLILPGGPQTRVGSHRQFVLLARSLAKKGVPVLRFDYRGMGDSTGVMRNFEEVDDDIDAAIKLFFDETPNIKNVVILGLCDAASAALMYAPGAKNVSGMILLNPWIRSAAGEAKARLKYYYFQRLLNIHFWRKVIGGRFEAGTSMSYFFGAIKEIIGSNARDSEPLTSGAETFPKRMYDGLAGFDNPVLVIMSGSDLTGREFRDYVASSKMWSKLFEREGLTQRNLEQADHTFSKREWRDQVEEWVSEWLLNLE
ncbi:MAG: hydrolase 1, exosortase A system-associated [Pseudomonadales bacterium]|nr:hydrolase 1, exosortase A system-associated [Pseudomonadales bacterium]